jgi:hypothetical protein
MTKILNLSGSYSYTGSYLIKGQTKLLIAKRKQTSKAKASVFLLNKSNPLGRYISSLYYLPENTTGTAVSKESYYFDFQGYNYTLIINKEEQTAVIHQKVR